MLLLIPPSEMPFPSPDGPNSIYPSRSSSSSWVCLKFSLTSPAHTNLPFLEYSTGWNLVMIIWIEDSWFLQSQAGRLLSEGDGKDTGKQKQQLSQSSTLLWACHTNHKTTVHSAECLPRATIWPPSALCEPLFWEEDALKAHIGICQLHFLNYTKLWSWHSGTHKLHDVLQHSKSPQHPIAPDMVSVPLERWSHT